MDLRAGVDAGAESLYVSTGRLPSAELVQGSSTRPTGATGRTPRVLAPLLDPAGNSVKGQLAAVFLSRRLGMDIFATEPEGARAPAS